MMIFTDVDGSLIDHDTYSSEPAREALAAARARRVPVVLCSSKTLAEMRPLADALGLAEAPLLVENGGAAWFPAGWPVRDPRAQPVPGGTLLVMGTRVEALLPLLGPLAAAVQLSLRGFSAMDDQEVACRTGLSLHAAHRARQRQYSEPFVCEDGDAEYEVLDAAAQKLGGRVTQGSRFFHLTGNADKGMAVALVRSTRVGTALTLGIGDAPNDLPLLRAVDTPVLVPQPSGRIHPALAAALPRARHAHAPGPAGWNAAVLDWLANGVGSGA